MKANLTITSLDDLVQCYDDLQSFFEEYGKMQVTYSDKIKKESKSDAQTRTYFMWLKEIGDELGYTKEEMRYEYMDKFMLNIYVDNNIAGFKQLAKNMQLARTKLDPIEFRAIRKRIVLSMSHTDLSLDQMRDYLSSIKHHAQSDLQIVLTEPSMRGLI